MGRRLARLDRCWVDRRDRGRLVLSHLVGVSAIAELTDRTARITTPAVTTPLVLGEEPTCSE